jgi:hypothetical protein
MNPVLTALLATWIAPVQAAELDAAPIPDLNRSLPLFASVRLLDVKANSETPTCDGARDAVMAKAKEIGAKSGHTEILALYQNDLSEPPITTLPCRQTGIPDAPSGAVASARVLIAEPGAGHPETDVQRQLALVGLLTAVHQTEADALELVQHDGAMWVDTGIKELEDVLPASLDTNGRGVHLLQREVIPWVSRWAPLAGQTAEVVGAVLTIDAKSETEKGKRKERFEFRVASEGAAAFTVGKIAEPEWAASLAVTVDDNPKKKPGPEPMTLDVTGGGGSVTAGGDRTLDGDISDLQDE